MQLYHATPKANVESILKDGLLPHLTNGKIKATWFHTKSRRHWAIAHTQKRHNLGLDDIVILSVNIPRAKLTRRWKGIWSCAEVVKVNPNHVTSASELADSPITDN